MAKLNEILEKKGSGKWFSIQDVIGKDLTVVEDINPYVTDIREDEGKKYFCLRVLCGTEIKDIHLAKGALRALAEVMPKNGTWKGKRFQVTGVSGKGFDSKTSISLLVGDYDMKPEHQTRIDVQPIPIPPTQTQTSSVSPNSLPVDPMSQAVSDVLVAMKAGIGVQDTRLTDFVKQVCIDRMHVVQLTDLMSILKYSGRIKNEGGVWKVSV